MSHRHMSRRRRSAVVGAAAAAAGAIAAATLTSAATGATTAPKSLTGTFLITKGTPAKGAPHGSHFRMVYPGGSVIKGKFFANPNAHGTNKTYTLISPGTGGGLRTGKYQPAPNPAFDARGNSRARSIILPTSFTGINFSVVTTARDAQTGKSVAAPSIKVRSGKLSGDLRAFAANWNNLSFNQGSPKPNGTRPGLTASVSGTYNAKTHAYVLNWTSAIVGGPFNGFTGVWHLTGTFRAGK
jgi:hypothetical protein